MPIVSLDHVPDFPPTHNALEEPNGLLAVGGDLGVERLINAYRQGIFPWYDDPQPILWWTPNPRCVLFPEELHISRSLRKTLRSERFSLAVDRQFEATMRACAQPRDDGFGTWIDEAMISAYRELHALGIAHSIEVMDSQGALVGGLYGVSLGKAFFGESMFSRQTDASKVALVALVAIAKRGNFGVIDCQVASDHLESLGARSIPRLDFEACLAQTVYQASDAGIWTLPANCGGLL